MKAAPLGRIFFAAMMGLGCASSPVAGALHPAILTETSPQLQAELKRLLSEAMHGIEITLEPEVFTENSLLVIEHSPEHMRMIGRQTGTPTRFQLLTDGDTCWLSHLATGERWPLRASCRPQSQ